MATSLLSLALDHQLDPTIAMTGELTVTGKVLRIGGLREKAVAARRAGAKKIIFPADNMSDWLELPPVCHFHRPLHSFKHRADIATDIMVLRTSRKAWKVTP
jgi:Lon-like ATP-dependent protease